MLFFEYDFLFLFLPICFIGFLLCLKYNPRQIILWLTLSSIVFYAHWNVMYLLPLFGSILFNYYMGSKIHDSGPYKKILLIFAIGVNLILLGYYKYSSFIINLFVSTYSFDSVAIVQNLPLGISFYTFTQIAFLVDVYYKRATEFNIKNYALFVTYFPHLIAGPIIHHKEMMPQFKEVMNQKLQWENISLGMGIFIIGLLKKVIFADYFIPNVTVIFDTQSTEPISFLNAWIGTLSYTMQIYFDFSGYCDMALGLSKLFGIKLPINFYSPYKSTSFIDFWHRWHITLGRFLKDYVYIPLGGNRRGKSRQYINLVITLFLGGLWHGAGWTFILWGIIHGILLAINHIMRALIPIRRFKIIPLSLHIECKKLIVFLIIALTWVPFRAPNLETSLTIWKGCLGLNGITFPQDWLSKIGKFGELLVSIGVKSTSAQSSYSLPSTFILFIVTLIALYAPNSIEIFNYYRTKLALFEENVQFSKYHQMVSWHPTKIWAFLFAIGLIMSLWIRRETTEFLYFQF